MLLTRCPDCDRALLATDTGRRACPCCGQVFDGRNVLDRDYWTVRKVFARPPQTPVKLLPHRRRDPVTVSMFDNERL